MTIDVTQILVLIIELLATVVSVFVIRYLKQKLTAEQLDTLKAVVKTGVYGAEQLFQGTGLGEQKKEYVLNLLKEKGYDIDLEVVNAAIEAEVKALKLALA